MDDKIVIINELEVELRNLAKQIASMNDEMKK